MGKKLPGFSVIIILIPLLFIQAAVVPSANQMLSSTINADGGDDREVNNVNTTNLVSLYESLQLSHLGLSKPAFDRALEGYQHFKAAGQIKNDGILTIIDFTLPSSKKRLFILDINQGKLLFNTYVAHGRGSGREIASTFSNVPESYKSSLGFYITGNTYMGKHGFSLKLYGKEKGINDNADSRAIVMHSASYVTEEAIKMQGFIGRSLGCPALPEALNKPIIEKIKEGSCLFIYSCDKNYLANSSIINRLSKI